MCCTLVTETTELFKLGLCTSATSYHLVMVVKLQHNIRGLLKNVLRVSINLHIIENQSLVPGWVQRCT